MTKNRDERIVNRGEREEPEARSTPDAKEDPARAEALPVSPEELQAILRDDALANALPQPPAIPGWHQCWLSTTNQYTPVQHFIRLGYVPVKPEEVPGWQYLKQHSAQMGDIVTCNEMVLYKIPEAAYQQIMKSLHHERPNAEAERLRANIDMMKEGGEFRDSEGNSLVKEEGDGFGAVLDRRVRVGNFE